MVISSDISLKGMAWNTAIEKLAPIFKTRTNYSLFLLSTAIGIMYDKQIDSFGDDSGGDAPSVPRVVFNQHGVDVFDILFQTAILTTSLEKLSNDERMVLAFDDKSTSFNKISFITKFANYGVTKLVEKITSDSLETMENIKDFLASTMEGTNFEIDPLSENDLIIDDINF